MLVGPVTMPLNRLCAVLMMMASLLQLRNDVCLCVILPIAHKMRVIFACRFELSLLWHLFGKVLFIYLCHMAYDMRRNFPLIPDEKRREVGCGF